MFFFKQCVHIGLVLSTLLFCTLLLVSYTDYFKLPSSSSLRIIGQSSVEKRILAEQNRVLEVSPKHVHMRVSAGGRRNMAMFSNESSKDDQCSPKTNIAFFKMHKCSSSTVQNILFRYGEEHRLDFVLPPIGNQLGDLHAYFKKTMAMEFPVKRYNLICHHTRFSYTGMREIMARDTVFVTIIRDPVTMFESLFTYTKMDAMYNLPEDHALELFLEKPDYYYKMNHGPSCKARNPMMYELGVEEALLGDRPRIDQMIEELEDQLDLVMMTEYFEESLILLKDLMCWDTDDIVYFVLNARNKTSVKAVLPAVAAKIRKWNFGDMKLYDIYNKTFWRKVEAFGHDRMKQEVAKLRERNEYFRNRCIAKVVNHDEAVWHPHGIAIKSFRLKPEAVRDKMCVQMARTELPYTDHIRRMQMSKYATSLDKIKAH